MPPQVWRNANVLSRARAEGTDALAARIAELDRLSEARITDPRVPGQILLKLAIKGFGVELAQTPLG